MAFAQVEPFGEKRADLRSAIVACTFANAHRGKNQKAFKPVDFIPQFERPEPQSSEQMKMMLRALAQRNKK